MKEEVKPEIQSIQKSGKILAEVTSRIIGPLIGAAVAGPVGTVAGGVAGSIIKYGLEEFMEMWLTPKEVKRVGTSAEYIINEINNSLLNGSILNPKLFEVHNGEMSEAEELFEGVLLKCKTEYQEKKIKLISNIFVNSAFDSTISSTTANQILSLSEGMTYRKLCIISFFGRKDKEFNSTELLDDPYYCYNENKFSADLESLKQDIFELCNQRIIDNNKTAVLNTNDIIPKRCSLTKTGQLIFKTLALFSISSLDISPMFNELKLHEDFELCERTSQF